MAPASNTAIAIINIGSPPGSAGYSRICSVNQAQYDLVTFAANEGYPAEVTMHSDVVATSTAPISIAPLAIQVTAIFLPSKGGFAPSPTIEWNLDTQVALAAAGGTTKQLLLYIMTTNSNSDQVSAFAQAVTDNMAKVISLWAANCESAMYQDGSQKFEDQIFLQAMAQGQVVVVSSGDKGAYTSCVSSPAVNYPASSANVIAVGGTTLTETGKSYSGETAWSCTSYANCFSSTVAPYGGSGGGISGTTSAGQPIEPAPAWQISSGVLGGSTHRGIPDVAFEGDPASGAILVIGGTTPAI